MAMNGNKAKDTPPDGDGQFTRGISELLAKPLEKWLKSEFNWSVESGVHLG
jgi:hypothetical protein